MDEFRRLLGLARPHAGRLGLATLILLLGTGLNLAIPTNLGQLVGTVFGLDQSDSQASSAVLGGATLNRVALTLGAILLLRMVTGVLAGYILEWTGERIVADLRSRLFEKLVRLDLRFFADNRIGEITSRMTNDVSVIQYAVTSMLTAVIERTLLAAGSLTLMILVNWRLTLAVFVTMPLVVVVARLFGRQVYHTTHEVQDRLAAANSVMEESLSAIRVVKTFVREPHEVRRFNDEIRALFAAVQSRALMQAIYVPLATSLFMTSIVFVLWLSGREVLAGRLTAASMLEFLVYASYISSSATVFGNAYSTYKRANGATERVFELLNEPIEIQSPPNGVKLQPMRGSVQFDNVTFGYDPERIVLEAISFKVAPGEVVALVGVSGVGKSTLVDLIPRFRDVQAGRVLVDEVDVRDLDLHSLRTGIASVPQETVLFGTTVRENLLYGRLDATEVEMIQAAKAANAHEFIMALPKGYDTLVGERGVKLSGGQRQRLSIARALLKQPAILLLDEATSSLDSESERAVQAALDELLASRGRTTLVIAHRLSTIRNADRILVFAPVNGVGRLVEEGDHHTLLGRRGAYYHLYTMQFREEPMPAMQGQTNGDEDWGVQTYN